MEPGEGGTTSSERGQPQGCRSSVQVAAVEDLDHDFLAHRNAPERGGSGLRSSTKRFGGGVPRDLDGRLPPALVTKRIWRERFTTSTPSSVPTERMAIPQVLLHVSRASRNAVPRRLEIPGGTEIFAGRRGERNSGQVHARVQDLIRSTTTKHAPGRVPADTNGSAGGRGRRRDRCDGDMAWRFRQSIGRSARASAAYAPWRHASGKGRRKRWLLTGGGRTKIAGRHMRRR